MKTPTPMDTFFNNRLRNKFSHIEYVRTQDQNFNTDTTLTFFISQFLVFFSLHILTFSHSVFMGHRKDIDRHYMITMTPPGYPRPLDQEHGLTWPQNLLRLLRPLRRTYVTYVSKLLSKMISFSLDYL